MTYTEEQRKQLHRLLDHTINLGGRFHLHLHVPFREDNESLISLLASTTSGRVDVSTILAEDSPTDRSYRTFSTEDVTLFSQETKTRKAEQRRFDVV